ncbi:divalent-cation tolerance protein CutA [Nanoarchaeota archaeon]
MIIIYVTCKDKEEAEKIGRALVDDKLVACANFFPITSIFFWEGDLEKGNEIILLLKSRGKNWEIIQNKVKELHSYDTPCIIKIKAEANSEYEKWVKQNC